MRVAVVLILIAGCWSESRPKPAEPAPAPAPAKTVATKDIVQPVTIERVPPPYDETPLPPPPPPPPPPPNSTGPTTGPAPMNVAPQMLEGTRIAGDKAIVPDDIDKVAIQQSGKDKLIGSFKLCLDTTGAVSHVVMLKSTGVVGYDTKIMRLMRATWRYSPFLVNGQAANVCTAITFIYSQKSWTPPPPPSP